MTIEIKKVANINEAIQIINSLLPNGTFEFDTENYSDDYQVTYRHFGGTNEFGATCFGMIESFIDGKLVNVRFVNTYRRTAVDIEIENFTAEIETATDTNVDTANNLPTGNIIVKSGTEAWALVGKYFPKDNLEFYRASKGFNNEDAFCYTLDEIIYVHATCTPDNKRVECIEVINTYESGSKRHILTVYINHDAEVETNVDNAPEVARFQRGTTYRYYDANTGEPLWYITIEKRTNTTVTVSGEKFKVFIQPHDRLLNYNKPTESFIRGNYRIDAADACEETADQITPSTLQKFIEAKKEVSYWRNSTGARIWQIAYIRYGVNGGIVGQTPWLNHTMKEADRYLKDEYGMTLLEYLAAEDKWNATDKGAILKDKIERDCKPSDDELPALFPAEDNDDEDELIDPPEIDKTATADSLTRAMTIALEKYQYFCLLKNLTGAKYELKLYNICRNAMTELWKGEAA